MALLAFLLLMTLCTGGFFLLLRSLFLRGLGGGPSPAAGWEGGAASPGGSEGMFGLLLILAWLLGTVACSALWHRAFVATGWIDYAGFERYFRPGNAPPWLTLAVSCAFVGVFPGAALLAAAGAGREVVGVFLGVALLIVCAFVRGRNRRKKS